LAPYALSEDFMSDDFMVSDFMVSEDFVSDIESDDFVASCPFVSLGLADGEVVCWSVLVFVSVAAAPLPLTAPPVEPLADGADSVLVSVPVDEGELPLLSPPVVAPPDESLELLPLGPARAPELPPIRGRRPAPMRPSMSSSFCLLQLWVL